MGGEEMRGGERRRACVIIRGPSTKIRKLWQADKQAVVDSKLAIMRWLVGRALGVQMDALEKTKRTILCTTDQWSCFCLMRAQLFCLFCQGSCNATELALSSGSKQYGPSNSIAPQSRTTQKTGGLCRQRNVGEPLINTNTKRGHRAPERSEWSKYVCMIVSVCCPNGVIPNKKTGMKRPTRTVTACKRTRRR